MGAICEKIDYALLQIHDGFDTLNEYREDISLSNLNEMAMLTNKLQLLIYSIVLSFDNEVNNENS